jgi:hypothetical protein
MIPWCSKFALTPSPLNTDAVLKQVGGSKAFHEFVVSGNEEALEQFYESGRQSPVLGGEEFVERIRTPLGQLVKEHPRYQRRGGANECAERNSASSREPAEYPETKSFGEYEVKRTRRGRWRCIWCGTVAIRRFGRRRGCFGVGSYGAVGWCCGVQTKKEKEKGFRDQIERLVREFCQQKTLFAELRKRASRYPA